MQQTGAKDFIVLQLKIIQHSAVISIFGVNKWSFILKINGGINSLLLLTSHHMKKLSNKFYHFVIIVCRIVKACYQA